MAIYRSGRLNYGGRWARAFVRNAMRVAKEASAIFRWDGSKWIKIFGGQTVNPPAVHDESHSSLLSAYGEPWELGGGSGVADRSVESPLAAYGVPWALPADRTHLPDSLLAAYGVTWDIGLYTDAKREASSTLVAVGTPWEFTSPRMRGRRRVIATRSHVEASLDLFTAFRDGTPPYGQFVVESDDVPVPLSIENDRYLKLTLTDQTPIGQLFSAGVRGYDSSTPSQSAVASIEIVRVPEPYPPPVLVGPSSAVFNTRTITLLYTIEKDPNDFGIAYSWNLDASRDLNPVLDRNRRDGKIGVTLTRPQNAIIGDEWNVSLSFQWRDGRGYEKPVRKDIVVRYVNDPTVVISSIDPDSRDADFPRGRTHDSELPVEIGPPTPWPRGGRLGNNNTFDIAALFPPVPSTGRATFRVNPVGGGISVSPATATVDYGSSPDYSSYVALSSMAITVPAGTRRGSRFDISGIITFAGGTLDGISVEWRRTIVVQCLEKRVVAGTPTIQAVVGEEGDVVIAAIGGCPGPAPVISENVPGESTDIMAFELVSQSLIRARVQNVPAPFSPGTRYGASSDVGQSRGSKSRFKVTYEDGTEIPIQLWATLISPTPTMSFPDRDLTPGSTFLLPISFDWPQGVTPENTASRTRLSIVNLSEVPPWLTLSLRLQPVRRIAALFAERTTDISTSGLSFEGVLRYTFANPSAFPTPYIETTFQINAVVAPIHIAGFTMEVNRADSTTGRFALSGGEESFRSVEIYPPDVDGLTFAARLDGKFAVVTARATLEPALGEYEYGLIVVDSAGRRSSRRTFRCKVIGPAQRRFYSFGDNISVSVSDSFG